MNYWREWAYRVLLLALGTATVLMALALFSLGLLIYSIGVP